MGAGGGQLHVVLQREPLTSVSSKNSSIRLTSCEAKIFRILGIWALMTAPRQHQAVPVHPFAVVNAIDHKPNLLRRASCLVDGLRWRLVRTACTRTDAPRTRLTESSSRSLRLRTFGA